MDVSGPVTAVHPVTLYERGLLAQWQREIVSRRIRQPVKQAFRELYLLTPAEREAGDVSRRFAGHVVDGRVAAQLLMVSVAGTGECRAGSATMAQSRAQLLAALIADLGLDRVTVDGTCAVVRGTRATTYRVHLTSGSIYVEPGGYLCVVPASFGGSGHGRLFLPFADEDRMTSVILSKVLLLNDDEHITDPTILAQLPAPGS